MKVAIYSRGGETVQAQDLINLTEALLNAGISPVMYSALRHQFQTELSAHYDEAAGLQSFADASDLDDSFDALISLGGDGTLLDTVCLVRDKMIPVLGINFGRLGFLASLGKDNILEAVQSLKARSHVLDKRGLLHLDASIPMFGEEPFALNEVVVHPFAPEV